MVIRIFNRITVSINYCSRDSLSYILCKKSARPQWWSRKGLEHDGPVMDLGKCFFVCVFGLIVICLLCNLTHIIFDFDANSVKGVVNTANEENENLVNYNM